MQHNNLNRSSVGRISERSNIREKLTRTLTAVEEDFVTAIEDVQRNVKRTRLAAREQGYLAAAAAFKLAEKLHTDDRAWRRFQALSFWNDRTAKLDEAHCLRYAFYYTYGSHKGPAAERARAHARALDFPWKDGFSAANIFHLLRRHGGFKGSLSPITDEKEQRSGGEKAPADPKMDLFLTVELLEELSHYEDGAFARLRTKITRDSKGLVALTLIEVGGRPQALATS